MRGRFTHAPGHHHHHHPPVPWTIRPGFGDAPVGSIIAFAGALAATPGAAPQGNRTDVESTGWMMCDGCTLVTQHYPQLFAALGYLYGGSGSSFAIPDYRGYFLRGVNGAAGQDPDVAARVASAGGTSDGVGSTQTSAIQMHEHAYDYALDATPAASGQAAAGTQTSKTQLTIDGPVKEPSGFDVPTSTRETRPVNIYVDYLIKYSNDLMPFVL